MSGKLNQQNNCLIVNADRDNIALCIYDLFEGLLVSGPLHEQVVIKKNIKLGQRFAIKDIIEGTPVVQYGSPFGISTGIQKGELVHRGNVNDIVGRTDVNSVNTQGTTVFSEKYHEKYFMGYKRPSNRVGTRNYYLIVPTSQCASQVAMDIVLQSNRLFNVEENYPNVDGIVAIPNTEGCGCASNMQITRFLQVLSNFLVHPNIGGALIVDLGCEQTNCSALKRFLDERKDILMPPNDWLTIQKEGGTRAVIEKSLSIIKRQLPLINNITREKCSVSSLVVGTECGASDSFSGVTANPVIGNAIDKLIYGNGSAILSEVPEMLGAEQLLISRMRNDAVIRKFEKIISWYKKIAADLNVEMEDNLVPENKAGGLINSCIKSLGAIIKGGSTTIEDVLEYGEEVSTPGLSIMQGPGNDLESVTGMVASGANLVCFSTGRGTITGNAIVPVIKITSTTETYTKMKNDMDFNAGCLLEQNNTSSIEELGDDLFELMMDVASGMKTKTEFNNQRQFQVWTAGKLSL